jgi:hypothetical protein
MQQRKLSTFRCTLFDYKLTITDQNAVIGANPKSKGKGKRAAPPKRGGAKGRKGAVVAGNDPMNALAFVRSLFNAPAAGGTAKKKGARPPPRARKGKKKGEAGHSTNSVLAELFQYITEEKVRTDKK